MAVFLVQRQTPEGCFKNVGLMLSILELLNEKLDDEYSGKFSQCDDHEIMYWLLPQYQTLLTMKCASGYKKKMNKQTFTSFTFCTKYRYLFHGM